MGQFELFLKMHGPGVKCRQVSEETARRYQTELPSALIQHWLEAGWCGYADGLLWIVNPEDLREPMLEWLGPGKANAKAIARTAFGDIILWDGNAVCYLDVNVNHVFNVTQDIEIFFIVSLRDKQYLDSPIGRKQFRRARQRLGPLEPDEVYGYFPAIALGGPGTVESLQRVKLREYLSILAQSRGENNFPIWV
jgi:hypothetical protein